jgi:hypothetical protein
MVHVRTNKYLWILLSVILCLLGTPLLVDSIRHSGRYAEADILLGAVLTAFGLAAMFFAFEEYLRAMALASHMKRGGHPARRRTLGRAEDQS